MPIQERTVDPSPACSNFDESRSSSTRFAASIQACLRRATSREVSLGRSCASECTPIKAISACNERITVWYGNGVAEMNTFLVTQKGTFAPLFWLMVIVNFVIPVIILGIRRFRTIAGCVIASLGVCLGTWLERFLIVVPSLGNKFLPYSWSYYRPRPTEILITAATFAAMILLYTLFAKFVPIISIWEMKAGEHPAPELYPQPSEERALGKVHA